MDRGKDLDRDAAPAGGRRRPRREGAAAGAQQRAQAAHPGQRAEPHLLRADELHHALGPRAGRRRAALVDEPQRRAPPGRLRAPPPEGAVRSGLDEAPAMQPRRAGAGGLDRLPDIGHRAVAPQAKRAEDLDREGEGEVEPGQDPAPRGCLAHEPRDDGLARPRHAVGRRHEHRRIRVGGDQGHRDVGRATARAAPVDRPEPVEARIGGHARHPPPRRSARSRAQYSRRLAISRSKPRSTGR
jgi:hypothetical protein